MLCNGHRGAATAPESARLDEEAYFSDLRLWWQAGRGYKRQASAGGRQSARAVERDSPRLCKPGFNPTLSLNIPCRSAFFLPLTRAGETLVVAVLRKYLGSIPKMLRKTWTVFAPLSCGVGVLCLAVLIEPGFNSLNVVRKVRVLPALSRAGETLSHANWSLPPLKTAMRFLACSHTVQNA